MSYFDNNLGVFMGSESASRKYRMELALQNAFSPSHLQLVDESEKHRGHRGWNEAGETHFQLEIESDILKQKSRVAANQAIYKLLEGEFSTGLHAISIKVIY